MKPPTAGSNRLRKTARSTPSQKTAQELMRRLAELWNFELNQNERDQWDREARELRKKKKRSTGIHYFKRVNFPYLRAGRPLFRRPPGFALTGFFSYKGIQARFQDGKFTLGVVDAANSDPADFYVAAATPAGKPGVLPHRRYFTDLHFNATLADLANLGDAYVQVFGQRFGVPKPGQRLGLRITAYFNGTEASRLERRDIFVTA